MDISKFGIKGITSYTPLMPAGIISWTASPPCPPSSPSPTEGLCAAARKLCLSPSAVTRLVASLEGRLGLRLFQRTTRSVRLTDAGARYFERARRILADLEEADDAPPRWSARRPRGGSSFQRRSPSAASMSRHWSAHLRGLSRSVGRAAALGPDDQPRRGGRRSRRPHRPSPRFQPHRPSCRRHPPHRRRLIGLSRRARRAERSPRRRGACDHPFRRLFGAAPEWRFLREGGDEEDASPSCRATPPTAPKRRSPMPSATAGSPWCWRTSGAGAARRPAEDRPQPL